MPFQDPNRSAFRPSDVRAERDALALYEHFRRVARSALGTAGPRHTLPATAVANEAFLRLASADRPVKTRAGVNGFARVLVNSVLVDHARRRLRRKRGGDHARVQFQDDQVPAPLPSADRAEVSDALEHLARRDGRAASVVELRFFGGLAMEDIARLLDVSLATVERDWRFARAWLGHSLADSEPPGEREAIRSRRDVLR